MKRRTRPKPAAPADVEEAKEEEKVMQEPDAFEFYVRPVPKKRQAYISLQNGHQIGVNVAASRLLGPPPALKVGIDRKKNLLELRPASPDEKEALVVSKWASAGNGYTYGFTLQARGYLEAWGLEYLQGRRFAVEMVNGNLRADLNKPMPVDERKED